MKVLTNMSTYETWFLEEYLKIGIEPMHDPLFTDEELQSVIAESAPDSFPCLAYVETNDSLSGVNRVRYVYQNELKQMQEVFEASDVTA